MLSVELQIPRHSMVFKMASPQTSVSVTWYTCRLRLCLRGNRVENASDISDFHFPVLKIVQRALCLLGRTFFFFKGSVQSSLGSRCPVYVWGTSCTHYISALGGQFKLGPVKHLSHPPLKSSVTLPFISSFLLFILSLTMSSRLAWNSPCS